MNPTHPGTLKNPGYWRLLRSRKSSGSYHHYTIAYQGLGNAELFLLDGLQTFAVSQTCKRIVPNVVRRYLRGLGGNVTEGVLA
ncbi:MAG TPA: hypothetical protein VN670_05765 [Acidobacteriaceae bacterium]|nr:hypothetical protein [Acidobacteriaceae bacterium]